MGNPSSYDIIFNAIVQKYEESSWTNYLEHDLVHIFGHNLRIFQESIFCLDAIFWILFGPQGSGKTTVVNQLLLTKNIQPTDCVQCSIDNYVYGSAFFLENLREIQNDPLYADYVSKIEEYVSFLENKMGTNTEIEKTLQSHPINNRLRITYWTARKIFDPLNDLIMEKAIHEKAHTIFEIVGANSSSNIWYQQILNKCGHQKIKLNVIYPYVEQSILKIRYLKRAAAENYVLNIYDDDLVTNIMTNFKLFSGYATEVHIIDNNIRLSPTKRPSSIFMKEKNTRTKPVQIKYTHNTAIHVEQGLADAIAYICHECDQYMRKISRLCEYTRNCPIVK
jgi:hypothetical protein